MNSPAPSSIINSIVLKHVNGNSRHSTEQTKKLAELIGGIRSRGNDGGLKRVELHSNFKYDGNAEPHGLVAIYDALQPVDTSLLSENWFGHLMVVRCEPLDADVKKEDYRKKLSALQERLNRQDMIWVPEMSCKYAQDTHIDEREDGGRPIIHTDHIFECNVTHDISDWDPRLSTSGNRNMIGLYSVKNSDGSSVFYLVVNTNSGYASEYINKYILSERNKGNRLTWKELHDSVVYQQVQSYSKRNAQRLLHIASNVFDMKILEFSDVLSATPHPFVARPKLGLPDYHTIYNMISIRESEPGTFEAVYYNHISPLDRWEHGALVLSHTADGIYLFGKDPRNPDSIYTFNNQYLNTFPVDMQHTNKAGVSRLGAKVISKFNWDGKKSSDIRLPNEKETIGDMDPSLLRNIYGANYGYIKLIPVAVHLSVH